MALVSALFHRGLEAFSAWTDAFTMSSGGFVFCSALGGPDDLFNAPEDPFVLALIDPFSESGLRRD